MSASRRRRGHEEPEDREGGPPADPVAIAREIVLRQLTVRNRTRAELEGTLAVRGVPAEAAAEVLDRFAELRLIDDAGFAQQWVESRQRAGRSTRVLAQELRNKGVDPETVAETMRALDDDADHRAARQFAEKRMRSLRSVDARVRQRRVMAALARRGFPSGVIGRVMAELSEDEWESADD